MQFFLIDWREEGYIIGEATIGSFRKTTLWTMNLIKFEDVTYVSVLSHIIHDRLRGTSVISNAVDESCNKNRLLFSWSKSFSMNKTFALPINEYIIQRRLLFDNCDLPIFIPITLMTKNNQGQR